MVDLINFRDEHGNTDLHNFFLDGESSLEIFERLLEEEDLHIRNCRGQSVFHIAARHSSFLSGVTDLLLKYGASVNEIDNFGSSVLHETLHNPSVGPKIIEKLLKNGAYPDYRDYLGHPPIGYCTVSTLQADKQQIVEKMLIQYSVVKKMSLIRKEFLNCDGFNDTVICFHFCEDEKKRVELVDFRDACISEILEIGKVMLDSNRTLPQFLSDYSCNVDECLNLFNLKTVLCALQKNEYPIFREMLISAIERYEFEALIEDLLSLCFTAVSPSGKVINLSLDIIYKSFDFLPKRDLINFILAFYKF